MRIPKLKRVFASAKAVSRPGAPDEVPTARAGAFKRLQVADILPLTINVWQFQPGEISQGGAAVANGDIHLRGLHDVEAQGGTEGHDGFPQPGVATQDGVVIVEPRHRDIVESKLSAEPMGHPALAEVRGHTHPEIEASFRLRIGRLPPRPERAHAKVERGADRGLLKGSPARLCRQ